LSIHDAGNGRTLVFGGLEPLTTFLRRHQRSLPAAGVVLVTVAAYHFTLANLWDFLRLDTPLAFLPLLPITALVLAVITPRRYALAKPPIRDRHVDLLVGIPLLVVALLLVTLIPVITSAFYWSDRADVVSLALFAASATILTYGVTWFWRLKASFILLLLTCPALYLRLLVGALQGFVRQTDTVLAYVMSVLPVGARVGNDPGVLILTRPHGQLVHVAVETVSPTVNTVLGFAFIGAAILTTRQGSIGRKLIWWADGLALAIVLNVARLAVVVALTAGGNAELGRGAYHAAISALVLVATLLVMFLVLPRFGLRPKEAVLRTPSPEMQSTSAAVAPPAGQVRLRWARRRRTVFFALVLAATAFLALIDHGLEPFAAFGNAFGTPTVQPFNGTASVPRGWRVATLEHYPWAAYYFGNNVDWTHYRVVPTYSHASVYADVVITPSKSSLDIQSVLTSSLFRSRYIRTWQRIDLGSGVYGLVLNYYDPRANARWGGVAWTWPVVVHGDTYYERVLLTSAKVARTGTVTGFTPAGGIQDVFLAVLNRASGGRMDPTIEHAYQNVDLELESAAQALVRHALQTRI